MKLLLIILSSFIVVQAGPAEEYCDGVKIKGICHVKEVLKSGLKNPYNLAVDLSRNTVYFSVDRFQSAKLNIITKDYEEIPQVKDGFSHAVDPKTNEVYIAGIGGIYKYDPDTKTAQLYGAKGVWTESLYFKDTLFYIDFPANSLYTLSNGVSTKYEDLAGTKVRRFVIDKDNDMFFTDATGLYSRNRETKETVLYIKADAPKGLAVDSNGDVYVCLDSGVSAVKKTTKSLEHIVDVSNCFGLAFDGDNNIIYGDGDSLVRVKPKQG